MTDLSKIKRVYLLGIGGIGMSALARYFRATGRQVAGYDRTPTRLTEQLRQEGIMVHYTDSPGLIPESFLMPEGTLIIYTPAVPSGLSEMEFLAKQGHSIRKRAEVLGMITASNKTVAVGGTHGKTTVTTMIAHILSHSPSGCNAFLGGISKNFNSNQVLNPSSPLFIVEADEYDRSFLHLYPFATVITAIDADHMDIYGRIDELYTAYNQFVSQTDKEGLLLVKKGLQIDRKQVKCRVYTYSLTGDADFRATNIKLDEGRYHFDLRGPFVDIRDISLIHPGKLNVENAVAACAMAFLLGTDTDIIRHSMNGFSGVLRRFDKQTGTGDVIYIDDYAHHPAEIEATIRSVRELYPGRKITGIFQPHLYTRTRDLAGEFARSLGMLDELILLEIYPAREEPIEGVSSALILDQVKLESKMICHDDMLLDELKNRKPEILITLGAGDIDRFVLPITELFTKRDRT